MYIYIIEIDSDPVTYNTVCYGIYGHTCMYNMHYILTGTGPTISNEAVITSAVKTAFCVSTDGIITAVMSP